MSTNDEAMKALLEGSEYLIDRKLEVAPIDKTFFADISGVNSDNTYNIVANKRTFENVPSLFHGLTLNTRVWVLAPQNNYSQMIILGKNNMDSYIASDAVISVNGKVGEVVLGDSDFPNFVLKNGTRAMDYLTVGTRSTGGAYQSGSVSIGFGNSADGYNALSVGSMVTASGNNSSAFGLSTIASGQNSSSFGRESLASGAYSHAEGQSTKATLDCCHSEGHNTIANGNYSHASNYYTTASGYASYAEGNGTTASGSNSHAQGNGSVASGSSSHAGGYYTIANGMYQTAIGKYNTPDGVSAFIIGNGTSTSSRSNAMKVDFNGNAWFSGTVYDSTGTTLRYTLPTASATVLGGIKVGDGLSIDVGGVLSAEHENVTIGVGACDKWNTSGFRGITGIHCIVGFKNYIIGGVYYDSQIKYDSIPVLAISTDGINFNQIQNIPISVSLHKQRMATDDITFVMISDDNVSLYYTTNGTTWTNYTPPSYINHIAKIFYTQGYFYIVDYNKTIYRSTNGINNWNGFSQNGISPHYDNIINIVGDENGKLAILLDYAQYRSVYTVQDNSSYVTWTLSKSIQKSIGNISNIVYTNNGFCLYGSAVTSSVYYGIFYLSTDLVIWSTAQTIVNDCSAISEMYYKNGMTVAMIPTDRLGAYGATESLGYLNGLIMASTTDFENWTMVQIPDSIEPTAIFTSPPDNKILKRWLFSPYNLIHCNDGFYIILYKTYEAYNYDNNTTTKTTEITTESYKTSYVIESKTEDEVLQLFNSWFNSDTTKSVKYISQYLSSSQQLQAKTNIGLDNVDNTSDLNKPISTATQTALGLKANTSDLVAITTAEIEAIFNA